MNGRKEYTVGWIYNFQIQMRVQLTNIFQAQNQTLTIVLKLNDILLFKFDISYQGAKRFLSIICISRLVHSTRS
jgi:hypothetical protein